MNILALDLATTTGYAVYAGGKFAESGIQRNAIGAAEQRGQRWMKFRAFLSEVKQRHGVIHVVYFEDVKNHAGVLAAHMYGGFRSHLELWCAINNISMVPVGVGKIKQHWTGKGNADKAAMVAEARSRGFNPKDDNEADALAILALALDLEGIVERRAARLPATYAKDGASKSSSQCRH